MQEELEQQKADAEANTKADAQRAAEAAKRAEKLAVLEARAAKIEEDNAKYGHVRCCRSLRCALSDAGLQPPLAW